MRWLSLLAGFVLIALAFAAASRVADTREGLVAEIITLLGGAAGVLLLIYGLAARKRTGPAPESRSQGVRGTSAPRSRKDLLLGAAGLVLAAVLLSGLAVSGGFGWALLGAVLLLPMIAGSVYLCLRFLRASP